jgi:hypothetical protein
VHGWWLAVPLIVGTVIILDDHYRHSPGYHHYRCYRC